jgi:hypothetical protein
LTIESVRERAQKVGFAADLDCGEDGVSLADDANNDGTLLDGFLGVFDLKDTTLRRAGEARG